MKYLPYCFYVLCSFTILSCGDDSAVITTECITNADCDDGVFCNGAEICNASQVCEPGTAMVIDDGVGCTIDSCDEVNDVVVHAVNTPSCNNGLFCDGVEVCDPVNDCQPGTAPSVSDGVSCTDDSCDEINDVIVHVANNANCDNGLFCDGTEICSATSDCLAGLPPFTNDGVNCTDDSCDEVNDVIVHVVNNANCNNGLFCDGVETCDAINNCLVGTPPNIDDGVVCTDDSCNEATDMVVNTVNNANCDNGLFCDGVEVCNAISGCLTGLPPNIDDGVACTDDSCDETNNVVVHAVNDASCSNGMVCDGTETCDPISDCQMGTPPNIDDGVACTDDYCDETADVIVHVANNAHCDNGLFCDGAETCDGINDCQVGTPPNLDDGVACTDDTCDEVNDVAVNTASDANCDNGLFCDGTERCDAVNDCMAGLPPITDDGVACTLDSCDEVADMVVHTPNDSVCVDGDNCTFDTCDAVLDCQYPPDPICTNCTSEIVNNGTYTMVTSTIALTGQWDQHGLLDDVTLSAPNTQSCKVEAYFSHQPGSLQFQRMRVRLYDISGGGIAGLGPFDSAVPLFDTTYQTSDSTLVITDTGDVGGLGFTVLRYEAIETSFDPGPGNYGLFITFPDAFSDIGTWENSVPTGGSTECVHGWGTGEPVPLSACSFFGGPNYENAAFRLLGVP